MMRPMSIADSEAERAGVGAVDPSSDPAKIAATVGGRSATDAAPPSLPEMLQLLRSHQPEERSWALNDIALEVLVPRLAATVEQLAITVANQEAVISMCVEVALKAAERKPVCACCSQLDEIAGTPS